MGGFIVDIPEDDVFGFWEYGLIEPGTYGPFVQDGICLMLDPLPVGTHTLQFGAAWGDGSVTDITYKLTVKK